MQLRKRKRRKILQNKKLPWFSRLSFYDTRPGNEVGLFYNAPEPTRGLMFKIKFYQSPFNICHLHRH